MPERCVVFGCNNVRSKEKGILLHPISFYGKSESEKQTKGEIFLSIMRSVSLPVIFCSLTLAKTYVFSCKYNNYDAVFIRETERCNGKFSASTGSVQVLISLSRSVFSTAVHTKQNQSRLLKQSTFLVPWKPAKV